MSETPPDSLPVAAPKPSEPVQPAKPWIEQLQSFTTVGLFLGASCYGLGLLIVNLSLAQFGVYEESFAEADYIIVGGVFVILVVATELGFRFAKDMFDIARGHFKERTFAKAIPGAIVSLALPLMPTFSILLWCSKGRYEFASAEFWNAMATLAIIGWTLTAIWAKVSALLKRANGTLDGKMVSGTHDILFSIIALLSYLVLYATAVYPHLAAERGGGEREKAFLLVTDEGARVARRMGIEVTTDNTIGPISVLLQSSTEVVLLTTDASGKKWAVRLNRPLFMASSSVYK